MMITRNPISRKSDHQGDKNEIQLQGMRIFMDNGVPTDNVIDTIISHNIGSKLLDNVTLNNSHTTWNNSANKVHSQINVCVLHRIQGVPGGMCQTSGDCSLC